MTYKLFKKINKKRDRQLNSNIPILEDETKYSKDPTKNFILMKTNYKKTTKSIFSIMDEYKFEKSKSVAKQYDVHLKNNFTNYDLLEKIDLYTHTLNVCYEAAIDDKPNNIKSINILLALLHDFGKNSKIKNVYNSSNKTLSHEKISAMFVKEFFTDQIFQGNGEITKDLIKTISQTIKVQHSSYVAANNSYLYNLRKYDKNAREKEIEMLRRMPK